MGPWQSASGMLTVEMTSADPERLLCLAAEQGICLLQLSRMDDLTLRAEIYRRDFRRLHTLCRVQGARLVLLRRRGVYWVWKSLLRRPVLVLGTGLLLACMLYFPSRIYFFQVEGNQTIPENLILDRAAQCGLHFGVSRRAVRSEKVKNALLSAIPELEWAGVNTRGCVAVISVRERTEPSQEEPSGCGGILAARDGVIRSITVLSGSALCRPGQAVQAGDLLVSGYTDLGLCIRATPAKAEIYADNLRDLTVIAPEPTAQRGALLRTEWKYRIVIGKKQINFFKGSGIPDSSCVKITFEKRLTLPGGFVLPVCLIAERLQWYAQTPADTGCDAVQTRLTDFAKAYLTQIMTAGEILRQDIHITQVQGGFQLTGQYACREMIGRNTDWETLENYGKNDGTNR